MGLYKVYTVSAPAKQSSTECARKGVEPVPSQHVDVSICNVYQRG